MANQLYEFTMKVSRGQGCDMPAELQGAYVPCYVSAPDYQAAVRKGVAAITGMHYIFEDLQGDVREIPVFSWKDYVSRAWPEFTANLPAQEELPNLIAQGVVFFGPFAGFKA